MGQIKHAVKSRSKLQSENKSKRFNDDILKNGQVKVWSTWWGSREKWTSDPLKGNAFAQLTRDATQSTCLHRSASVSVMEEYERSFTEKRA